MKKDFTSGECGVVADDWMLWQLADSAFPTGGFAHSGGLEAAWQHRELRTSADLQEYVKVALVQFANGMLLFMLWTYDDPGRFSELDFACDSFLTNHVANRASRLQGRALLASASRIFGHVPPDADPNRECGHLSPVFGIVTRKLKIERRRASRLFAYWHLRGWLASAVRLGLIGPNEAQSLQHSLGPFAEALLERVEQQRPSEPVNTAPLLEIWQAAQDRLYSRLFQS